jgi:hypothetical protein
MSQPAGSHNSPCEAGPSKKGRVQGRAFLLQFRAGVGVDFAVQANFFKSRSCPLHSVPQYIVPRLNRERSASIAHPHPEINTSTRNFRRPTRTPQGFCSETDACCNILHTSPRASRSDLRGIYSSEPIFRRREGSRVQTGEIMREPGPRFPHPEPLPLLSHSTLSVYLQLHPLNVTK